MRGSIKPLSKGKWRVKWDAPKGADGTRRQHEHRFSGTKAQAEAFLAEQIAAQTTGAYVEPSKLTVKGYLEQWLQGYAAANTTIRTQQGYREKARYLIEGLGATLIQQLRPQQISRLYADMLGKGLSPTTIVHVHRLLREALHHAEQQDLIARNPADRVKPPRMVRPEVKVWNDEQLRRFLDAAKDDLYRDWYVLALLTGMRRSELAGLRWPNVDTEKARLAVVETPQQVVGTCMVVGRPKTAKSRRSVALDADAIAVLKGIRARQKQAALRRGEPWDPEGHVLPFYPGDVTRRFRQIVRKAGLPPLTLHGLRHQHASALLARGVHAKVVSERLGHSNIAITMDTYSHVLPGLQEDAIRGLGRIYSIEDAV